MSLCDLTLSEASDLIRSGDLSPVEYTRAFIHQIETIDPLLRAFIEPTAELALKDAHRREAEIARGAWRGPLHGIPYGLKDMIDYEGVRTTASSRIMEHHVATRDAFVTKRLKAAGAVFLGKLATYEFACGGDATDARWPTPKNPWDDQYITAGSSSGSAVAVAARMLPFALGTDTNGSIRNPAGRCGIVGMKPTYGRVSRHGVFPLARSMDHVGPMTRTVKDNALVLQAIAGHDPQDATSQPCDDILVAGIGRNLQGLRIGVARNLHLEDAKADPEQVKALEQAVAKLAETGAEIVDIRFPALAAWNTLARLLMSAEGYAVHEHWLKTVPESYGRGCRTRLLQGAFLTSTELLRAQVHRGRIATHIAQLMEGVDLLVTALSTDATPRVHDTAAFAESYAHQVRMPFNLSGHPAMVIPVGFTRAGLPMSMQLVGRHFGEATMYRVAAAYEAATRWHERSPHQVAAASQAGR